MRNSPFHIRENSYLLIFVVVCAVTICSYHNACGYGKVSVMSSTSPKENWVPEWAKHVIWYQIFPERFRNGDPTNDPTVDDIKGAWPHDHTSPWEIHPWTSDWYELKPYEKLNGRSIWFNIQRRRYGGDLQGVLDGLDYLEDLGVTALYLNPVFMAPSLHKYDGSTYHHIDPTFGPDPEGDRRIIKSETPDDPSTWRWTAADSLMLRLIEEVHRRNMYIIFDGVFNHMGITSWPFRDVVEKGAQSRFKDWFTISSFGDPSSGEEMTYEGWFGVRELPELREDENGIVPGPRDYIFQCTRRWMDPDGDGDPSDGIDGWRLDVAFCIRHEFWKDWRILVKSINPNAYLTAEIVDPIDEIKPYLEGDEFDAVMNYNFTFACAEFFAETKTRISPHGFDTLLMELRKAFDPDVAYVMQNLLDSHDTDRIGSHIVNRAIGSFRDWSAYFNLSKPEHNPAYDTRKPDGHERRIQKLMAVFQMTYVGAPMIYYGDESGIWGANDPCCRKPMIWDDLSYDDEVYRADGSVKEEPDPVTFAHDLHGHYRRLCQLRNRIPALRIGNFESILWEDFHDVYAFRRSHESETVTVILNRGERPVECTMPWAWEEGEDQLTLNRWSADNGWINVLVPPVTGVILLPVDED